MSAGNRQKDIEIARETDVDAVVVGAGFGGMYMLHRLRELGFSTQVYEKADDVGGTWYWNRYPGARCDSESYVYCYSFSDELLEEWDWSHRFAEQPEVLEYLQFAADRLDVRRDIEFNTEIESAIFDEQTGTWEVTTGDGTSVTTQFFINAVGCLSKPTKPNFDGLDTFEGEWYHTAKWPHEPVDFTDKRIAVIGTGATGIQVVPIVAQADSELVTVFQRTPNYAVPARNRPFEPDEWERIQDNYDAIWEEVRNSLLGFPITPDEETAADLSMEEVEEILDPKWEEVGGYQFILTFKDLLTNEETNEKVSSYIRSKIRETIDDPELAEKLVPNDYPFGTKRPPLHTDYFKTFNRDDVELVDVRETPVERVTPHGIQTTANLHELDMIIFATGFDAVTGTVLNMDIRGRDDRSLQEKWAESPQTYLGISVHEFPNMFVLTGPQSPSVLSNMPTAIEQHVDWIADAVEHMRERDKQLIEPTKAGEDRWTEHNKEVAERTLYPEAESWYQGANIPGKPNVFLPYVGGFSNYGDILDEAAEKGYEGFELSNSVQRLEEADYRPNLSVLQSD